jgi:dTDP-4-amino-4,6-dideoxygalactose transaminase
MYYVLLQPGVNRQRVLDELGRQQIFALFHYVPLHSSPGGLRYGRAHDRMKVTDDVSERLIRLPMWMGISTEQQERVAGALSAVLSGKS